MPCAAHWLPGVPRRGLACVESLDASLERAERESIERALARSASKSEAARSLGISRRALYRRLERHQISDIS